MNVDIIEIAKLELQPGDILFARIPSSWSTEQVSHAESAINETLLRANINVPVLFGTKDVEFQIIREAT